jgi:NADH-quinone oxidoreductase subunit F
MDFDTIMKAGSRMGTGPDHGDRSHGRHGLGGAQSGDLLRPRILRLVHALPRRPALDGQDPALPSSAARGRPAISRFWSRSPVQLGPGKTFCAHAPGAVEPLQSALKFFRAEFERGIGARGRAPDGVTSGTFRQGW